jgi:hypothetical protein
MFSVLENDYNAISTFVNVAPPDAYVSRDIWNFFGEKRLKTTLPMSCADFGESGQLFRSYLDSIRNAVTLPEGRFEKCPYSFFRLRLSFFPERSDA